LHRPCRCRFLAAPIAEARPRHAVEAVRPDTAISLHQAIADAWARLPQRNNFAAQQNVAAANYLAGSTFFPRAPTATGSFIND